jgi:ParB/RepB/Spo0J family partition protein
MKDKIVLIPIDKLIANPLLERKSEEKEEHPNDLETSIRKNGQKTPILVRPKGNKFEIIDGHRRRKICKKLKHKNMKCIIDECSDKEAIDNAIVKNEMGKNYSIADLGRLLAVRMEMYYQEHPDAKRAGGNKAKQLEDGFATWYSENHGLSMYRIYKAFAMNKLDDSIKRKIVKGANFGNQKLKGISEETGYALSHIKNKGKQRKIYNIAMKRGMEAEKVKRLVEEVENGREIRNVNRVIERFEDYKRAKNCMIDLTKILNKQSIIALPKDKNEEILDLLEKLLPAMNKVKPIMEERKRLLA